LKTISLNIKRLTAQKQAEC